MMLSLYEEDSKSLNNRIKYLEGDVSRLEKLIHNSDAKSLALEEALEEKYKKTKPLMSHELYMGYYYDVLRYRDEQELLHYKAKDEDEYQALTGRERVVQAHYDSLPKYSKKYEKLMVLVGKIFLSDGNPNMKEIKKLEHYGFEVHENKHYVISVPFGPKMEFSTTPSRKNVGRKCKDEFMGNSFNNKFTNNQSLNNLIYM